jgi:hypothetical protein
VFGWVMAFGKAIVGCDFWKSDCEMLFENWLVEQLWFLVKFLSL